MMEREPQPLPKIHDFSIPKTTIQKDMVIHALKHRDEEFRSAVEYYLKWLFWESGFTIADKKRSENKLTEAFKGVME